MLKLKLIKTGDSEAITPTIFPDKTSQVWKLDEKYIGNAVKITWNWEGNESELIWLNQLICLLNQMGSNITELCIPYLPYARQDKEIGNDKTFSRFIFFELLLTEHVGKITTMDIHSGSDKVMELKPFKYILQAVQLSKATIIVFPDAGAYKRYAYWLEQFPQLSFIVLDKVRNQLTGKIEDLAINEELTTFKQESTDSAAYNLLIIDDLSDYGGTFKKAANFLKQKYFAINISLYVTHFLGHGDIESYKLAGIIGIYTSNTLDVYRKKFNCEDDGVVVING